MIIVSNEKIKNVESYLKNSSLTYLDYASFIDKAFGDEGLDIDGGLSVNVSDLEEDVFGELKDVDGIIFFTLGDKPNFVKSVAVEDWYEKETVEKTNDVDDNIPDPGDSVIESIAHLLDDSTTISDDTTENDSESKNAKIYVFGSSKGGTGKTFTSILSTYRYAKTHPDQKIALVDFDIIDGQIGISIHKLRPTIGKYYTEYQKGYRDFKTMKNFSVKANNIFPSNVDFYLAPTSGSPIENGDFWFNIIQNCIENYDVVVFDTGIDYLNIIPISYVYKAADKIILITTTSIKSVNSVTKQIGRLKGEIKSPGRNENGERVDYVFTKDDEMEQKLNVVITQMVDKNKMNKTIYNTLSNKCNVIATFGIITEFVSQAEFFGFWNIFDNNTGINKSLDDIMA